MIGNNNSKKLVLLLGDRWRGQWATARRERGRITAIRWGIPLIPYHTIPYHIIIIIIIRCGWWCITLRYIQTYTKPLDWLILVLKCIYNTDRRTQCLSTHPTVCLSVCPFGYVCAAMSQQSVPIPWLTACSIHIIYLPLMPFARD